MRPAYIVLIEDNPADVLLVQMALKQMAISHYLRRFENGTDALTVLCAPEEQTAPDAILLDLKTPRTDGFEVLLKLQQFPHLSQVPIVILTSSRAQSDKHRAAIHGARYIEKPSQLQEFLSSVGHAVRELLHHNAA